MLPDMTVFPENMLMPSLNAPVPGFETLMLQRGKWAQLYDNDQCVYNVWPKSGYIHSLVTL